MSKTHPNTSSLFAIVSPCSTCNNKRSSPDPVTGLPACPRQVAKVIRQQYDGAGQSSTQLDPLVLTGNEGTDATGLVNPVYSDDLHSVLVWYATLNDNSGIVSPNGTLAVPNLLDPSFDTTYIQCNQSPCTPADPEATYYQKGAWQEGDQIHVLKTQYQQDNPSTIETPGASFVLVDGFGTKVHFPYNRPRTPVDKDFIVAGT